MHLFLNLNPVNLNRLGYYSTLDLNNRLMTPFERLSAVRSEVAHTDMLLLSLLALEDSTSSAPPATDKDRPREKEGEGKKRM